jgi:uncharacterized membrane protein
MATFKVIVSRRDSWSVLVEAENEEQAKDIAKEGFDKDELDYEELQAQDGLFIDDIYEEIT